MAGSAERALLTVGAAALGAAAAYAAARTLPERSRQPWARTNHAGRPVTLLEGPAHAAGLATGAVLAGPPTMVAAVAAASLGALDDLVGNTTSKGLKGHLRAAAQGQVTTGLLKIVGLGVTGAVTVALADRRARSTRWAGSAPDSAADTAAYSTGVTSTLVGGAAVAGMANLLNLFDLRPGRALKVGMLVATPMVLRPTPGRIGAAAAVGASLGVLRPDLTGEAMLGDTGANALGALLGLALVERRPTRTRLALLTVVAALTLASEKVSFTKVIESTPVLREIDGWGRASR